MVLTDERMQLATYDLPCVLRKWWASAGCCVLPACMCRSTLGSYLLTPFLPHTHFTPSGLSKRCPVFTEDGSTVIQLPGAGRRVRSENAEKVSFWCLGSWKQTSSCCQFVSKTWANSGTHSPYHCLGTWQMNQPKALNVLKQDNHKGKTFDKFLEALKSLSQMKQVQKVFLAAGKQISQTQTKRGYAIITEVTEQSLWGMCDCSSPRKLQAGKSLVWVYRLSFPFPSGVRAPRWLQFRLQRTPQKSFCVIHVSAVTRESMSWLNSSHCQKERSHPPHFYITTLTTAILDSILAQKNPRRVITKYINKGALLS